MTIGFPINSGAQGPTLADLQDALQLCLDKETLHANDPASRATLLKALKKDRAQQTYGDATRSLVTHFQQEHQLLTATGAASGEVAEPTPVVLNALLGQQEPQLINQGGCICHP